MLRLPLTEPIHGRNWILHLLPCSPQRWPMLPHVDFALLVASSRYSAFLMAGVFCHSYILLRNLSFEWEISERGWDNGLRGVITSIASA